jgi:hypothetical protein
MRIGREVLFCELKDETRTRGRDSVRSGNSICLCSIRWAESPARGTGSELCTALYVKLCITQSALLYLTWISFTSRTVPRISSWNTTCRQRNVGVGAQIIYPYSFSVRTRFAYRLYYFLFFHLEIQVNEPVSIIVQQDATLYILLYFCKLRCMFLVVTPPIIGSTYNCNYSIWHLSNFGKCSVWSELKMRGMDPTVSATFRDRAIEECAVGGVLVCCVWRTPPTAHSNQLQLFHDSGR